MLVRIPASLPPDDDLLIRLSERNPGFKIERGADGEITMVSPTGGFGGARSLQAALQLARYAERAGGKAFDSNQGWKIGPNDAVKSPDASWLTQASVNAVSPALRNSSAFLPIVPEVAIEVKSPSDDWALIVAKIDELRERGTSYAVAINPETREVVERGTPPPGLRLDFEAIIEA